jgi:hypothetical protein
MAVLADPERGAVLAESERDGALRVPAGAVLAEIVTKSLCRGLRS